MSEREDEFRDEDFLAADYAMGLLDARERIRAERRMRSDAAFRAQIEDWQSRLAPLAASIEPVPVPAHLWAAIEAELPVRRDPVREARLPVAPRQRLVPAFWRWLAIGTSGLAAASLAALAVLSVPSVDRSGDADPTPAGFHLAASIVSDDGLPIFAVVLDPQGGSATLVPLRLEPGPGQVPELWLVREGGTPESLGVFDADEPLRLRISPDTIAGDLSGGVLAISLEPEGGSPTGQPTGPVVGHGDLRSI